MESSEALLRDVIKGLRNMANLYERRLYDLERTKRIEYQKSLEDKKWQIAKQAFKEGDLVCYDKKLWDGFAKKYVKTVIQGKILKIYEAGYKDQIVTKAQIEVIEPVYFRENFKTISCFLNKVY